tara:strand:+ start:500 stop:1285 length:786 start_codon:yes stop_codon:yes gene_type:complete
MDAGTVRAASLLATAYRRRKQMAALPPDLVPQTLLEAYAIQELLVSTWGGESIGWKLSCTSSVAQSALGFDEPCRGRVMAGSVDQSPATIAGNKYFMRLIEPEFAFRLKNDLPPSAAPFSFEDVVGAVEALIPVIEIVDTAYEDWTSVGVLSLIADNMLSGGLVLGEPIENWNERDLAAHEVSLSVNGETVTAGRGGNVLDHPVNALTWLANDLPSMGMGLRAGEIIATGLSTGLAHAEAGDTAVADFGDWGQVTVVFTDV